MQFIHLLSRNSTKYFSTLKVNIKQFEKNENYITTCLDIVNKKNFKETGIIKESNINYITSLKLPNLNHCTREDVLHYYNNTYLLTDILFSSINNKNGFYKPPYHNLRHPLIFYYGHVTCFYINKLRLANILKNPIHLTYEKNIFEIGVDEMSWDDMSKNNMKWPNISEIIDYRKKIYSIILNIIKNHKELILNHKPITLNSTLWSLFMSIEHERIHLETSSVLMRELPLKYLNKPKYMVLEHPSISNKSYHTEKIKNDFIYIQNKHINIGKSIDFPSFGWDNEYGTKEFNDINEIIGFNITKYKITNYEYDQFVKESGYSTNTYWSKDGWNWKNYRNTKHPTFWIPNDPLNINNNTKYKYRLIFNELNNDLFPWNGPVIVNYHEAKAYAKWKSFKDNKKYHLITERIHHLIRDNDSNDDPIMNVNGKMSDMYHMNLNGSFSSESAVHYYPPNKKGFYDVFGNVWEWCEDTFYPLNNFKIHKFYHDFSTPCFDDKHQMIMGGSFLSTGSNGGTKFSRFHFRPHFFQHAGFRLVETILNK